ncbi:MAG: hypothetical protein CMC76_09855 [Flavobacteriaceae bacterium]|nr:hypothetical protein [Flavobacteriaceae bacterium]|tara:strand:- start:1611 stop:1910 length:300 start_codon:yes stop_codon:yes gene_type:complete
MDINKLTVGILINKNESFIIGANFYESKTTEEARKFAPKMIEELIRGKTFYLNKNKQLIDLGVSHVEVTSSISDNKSIYLKTGLESFENIEINDIIEIK